MKKIYIWLDDVRNPYDFLNFMTFEHYDVHWVKNAQEFHGYLENNIIDENVVIDFDHDLGDDVDGYFCADELVNYCLDNKMKLPECRIHSMNPVGAENIKALLKNFIKFQNDNN